MSIPLTVELQAALAAPSTNLNILKSHLFCIVFFKFLSSKFGNLRKYDSPMKALVLLTYSRRPKHIPPIPYILNKKKKKFSKKNSKSYHAGTRLTCSSPPVL